MKSKRCPHNLQSNHWSNCQRFCKMLMSRLNILSLSSFWSKKKDGIGSCQTDANGNVTRKSSLQRISNARSQVEIEKRKYRALSTFSIKLWIYLFHIVVFANQRYQNVKCTCCKSLSYKLEPIVQHCTHAALTELITTEKFPSLS